MNHNMPFTTGEVGCFASHYAIWHHMVERGIGSALILEDDFDLQEDFVGRMGSYLREAEGRDWNILYVGRSPMENDAERVSEHLVVPGYTLWTVAYMLRLDGARALLDSRSDQHMVPLDDFFSVAMGRGMDGQYNELAPLWGVYIRPILRGLAMNPPLVMPYVGSMFLSDTAMLRKGTRFIKDLPQSSASLLRPLDSRQAASVTPAAVPQAQAVESPAATPEELLGALLRMNEAARASGQPVPFPLEEPDAAALARSYQVVGSWDGWASFSALSRGPGARAAEHVAEVLVDGAEPLQFQVTAGNSWDQRFFPAPVGSRIVGPRSGGHGQNWLVPAPGRPRTLRIRWDPTGARSLSCSYVEDGT